MTSHFRTISITVAFLLVSTIAGIGIGTLARHNIQSDTSWGKLPFAQEITPSPQPAFPNTLSIPSLNIQAPIEHVGLDSQRRMDVPKDPNNVAWYNLGPRPGEIGNSVIAGHLDSKTGPAVFYKLDELQEGDKITITDANQKQYTFQVTRKATYPEQDFPLQEVFGPSTTASLNLITCQGTFSQAKKSYSHRTVIYTQRIS